VRSLSYHAAKSSSTEICWWDKAYTRPCLWNLKGLGLNSRSSWQETDPGLIPLVRSATRNEASVQLCTADVKAPLCGWCDETTFLGRDCHCCRVTVQEKPARKTACDGTVEPCCSCTGVERGSAICAMPDRRRLCVESGDRFSTVIPTAGLLLAAVPRWRLAGAWSLLQRPASWRVRTVRTRALVWYCSATPEPWGLFWAGGGLHRCRQELLETTPSATPGPPSSR